MCNSIKWRELGSFLAAVAFALLLVLLGAVAGNNMPQGKLAGMVTPAALAATDQGVQSGPTIASLFSPPTSAATEKGTQSGPEMGWLPNPTADTRPEVVMPQARPTQNYVKPAKKRHATKRKHHRKATRSVRPSYDSIFVNGRRYVPAG